MLAATILGATGPVTILTSAPPRTHRLSAGASNAVIKV
jgi:hypothetical protein